MPLSPDRKKAETPRVSPAEIFNNEKRSCQNEGWHFKMMTTPFGGRLFAKSFSEEETEGRSLLTKWFPKPLKEKKTPRATLQAGCFAPATNSGDFGESFPPRPRGRPSGRVPLEPPAFFNPSNGHPCPSPGGERPCSPKKGETGKPAFELLGCRSG